MMWAISPACERKGHSPKSLSAAAQCGAWDLATLCALVVYTTTQHTTTAYTYCTPHSRHVGMDTLHTYPHHNPVHYVDVSISLFLRRKVAQCNVFEAISLIGKQIDAGVGPCGVHCLCVYVCVGGYSSEPVSAHTGYVRSIALSYSTYIVYCV